MLWPVRAKPLLSRVNHKVRGDGDTSAGAGGDVVGAASPTGSWAAAGDDSGPGTDEVDAAGKGGFVLKKLNMGNKYIRIVAGRYRRTPIAVPHLPGLRPTPDRVRETLFNWLNHFWHGAFTDKKALDLFAGSGALGFEAASRGMSHVQMVEHNKSAALALHALRNKLKCDAVHIYTGDALQALHHLHACRYDLILLDPPFGQQWLPTLWPLLSPVLAPNGLVYIEAEVPLSAPDYFHKLRQGRAGAVHYHLMQWLPDENRQ